MPKFREESRRELEALRLSWRGADTSRVSLSHPGNTGFFQAAAALDSGRLISLLDAALAETPLSLETSNIAASLAARLAEVNPQAALIWALQHNFPFGSESTLPAIFARLSAQDPALASEWAGRLPLQRQRAAALSARLAGLAESDPAQALDEALRLGSRGKDQLGGIASIWARRDPQSCLDHFHHQKDSATWQAGAKAAIEVMARNGQSAEATRWIGALPDTSRRREVAGWLIAALGENNPAEAAALVDQMGAATVTASDISCLARRWSEQDTRAALRWLGEQAPSKAVWEAWSGIAAKTITEWSHSAVDALVAQAPSDSLASQMRASLAAEWAGHAPADAWAWSLAQPPSPATSAMRQYLLQRWIADDPVPASQAISQAVSSAGPDAAYEITPLLAPLAQKLLRQDSAAAFAWASTLPPAAAKAAVQNLALPATLPPEARRQWEAFIANLPQ